MDELTDVACRVLGCLIEKEATVPDSYPMTLNSLRVACNQKSSRSPVLDLDEATVLDGADELRNHGLARLVHQPGGRAVKYRHLAGESLVLDEPSLAVVSVLLLRGPQTLGEIRTRTERQFVFDSLDEVDHVLERLAGRDDPLVRLLPRRSGHKEARWIHLLGGDRSIDDEPSPVEAPASMAVASDPGEVAELRERIEVLERRLDDLLARLGEA